MHILVYSVGTKATHRKAAIRFSERLDFTEKQMSINVFHTITALKSIIIAYWMCGMQGP